jgi:hypothetical protein
MSGLVGLWHLNETALNGASLGADFEDSSGNGKHGTESGGVTPGVYGKFLYAASLDGSDDSFSTGITSGTNTYTQSAWIFPRSNTGAIFGNDNGNYSGRTLSLSSGTLAIHNCHPSACNDLSATITVSTGVWTHVVASVNNGTVSFYVNGVAAGTGSPVETFGLPWVIGHNGTGGTRFNGLIDEVAIWSRALHADEIKQLYRRGANRLKFQVRTCTTSNCSDRSSSGDWLGPDGSNLSYFSELQNNTAVDASGNPTGRVNTSFPVLDFLDFSSLTVDVRQYFQYRAILESDDTGTSCSGSWCSPELQSVEPVP